MGQFALGIRSLVLKSIIFVILAALLAWTLGGRLWGPARTDFSDQAVHWNSQRWYWRMLVAGKDAREVRWNLMKQDADGRVVVHTTTEYVDVAGPVAAGDGLYYAGREHSGARSWDLVRIGSSGGRQTWTLPDRLAVEQQLARAAAGLEVQDEATILAQRPGVLDPGGD